MIAINWGESRTRYHTSWFGTGMKLESYTEFVETRDRIEFGGKMETKIVKVSENGLVWRSDFSSALLFVCSWYLQ